MKRTKKSLNAGELDARDYKWESWNRAGAFDFLKQEKLPVAVKDVRFDEDTLGQMDYGKNGMNFSFYDGGCVTEHAAVLCEDGSILFCVVSGRVFTDTFHSADDIAMQYYKLTEIK